MGKMKLIQGVGGVMLKAPVLSKIGIVASKGKFLAIKYAPQIFMGLGFTGTVGGMVLTGRATLKLQDMLDEHNTAKDQIQYAFDQGTMDENVYNGEMLKLNAKMVAGMMAIYAPAVIVTGLSMVSFSRAYAIQQKRITSLTNALVAVTEAFQMYRNRVIEEHGEHADYLYYNGLYEEKVEYEEIDPETGLPVKKEKTVTTKKEGKSPAEVHQFTRFFDSSSDLYHPDPETNMLNLQIIQSQLNDQLHAQGYLFLNDALNMLGMHKAKHGQEYGWLAPGRGGKDGYVDFGLGDFTNARSRAFVNGLESVISINLNVDGYILDKVDIAE